MATVLGPLTDPASEDTVQLGSELASFAAKVLRDTTFLTRENAYRGMKWIEPISLDIDEDLLYRTPTEIGRLLRTRDDPERDAYSANEAGKRWTRNQLLLAGLGDELSLDECLLKNETVASQDTSTRLVPVWVGRSTYGNHQADPFKLRQTGTATDHQTEEESREAAVETPEPESLLIPRPDVVHNHLFAAAYSGAGVSRLLRVNGEIFGHTFNVLIDSGSTCNILRPRVVQSLNLTTEPTSETPVRMGNGAVLRCQGRCNEVPLKLNNQLFSISFLVYPIQVADIILGVQWLGTLGQVLADFAEPSISFYWNGVVMKLTGE